MPCGEPALSPSANKNDAPRSGGGGSGCPHARAADPIHGVDRDGFSTADLLRVANLEVTLADLLNKSMDSEQSRDAIKRLYANLFKQFAAIGQEDAV